MNESLSVGLAKSKFVVAFIKPRLLCSPPALRAWLAVCLALACAAQVFAAEGNLWIPGWRLTTPLPSPRAGSAVIAVNGTLYVIGGVNGEGYLRDTLLIGMRKNGALTSWRQDASLQVERGFSDVVLYKNYLYIVGGANGKGGHNLLRSVERARVMEDGTLGRWEVDASEMNLPRRCAKAAIINGSIYTFGGFGGAELDTVEHAKILEDGHLGPWEIESNRFTMPRYVNSVKVHGNVAYIFGGHDQTSGIGVSSVEWSHVDETGAFKPWQTTVPLQVARYGTAAVEYNNTMYLLGGVTGTQYVPEIEKSRLDPSGTLGPWQLTTSLLEPIASFGVAVQKDRIYIVGGSNLTGFQSAVLMATFNEPGDIGFWGSEQEAQNYKQLAAERAAVSRQQFLTGRVLEILQTSNYTYLRVVVDGDERWIAGARLTANVGDSVDYAPGVEMAKYFSKELQREFPAVMFASALSKHEELGLTPASSQPRQNP